MKRRWLAWTLAGLIMGQVGTTSAESQKKAVPSKKTAEAFQETDGYRFKKLPIKIGARELTVEIADSQDLRSRGLMNRNSLSDEQGMLFVFPTEMKLSFWMKNTNIPLSIGFFTAEGKLIQTMDMEPASPMDLDPKIYLSAKPSKYALEVAKGWFRRNSIKLGDILKVPKELEGGAK